MNRNDGNTGFFPREILEGEILADAEKKAGANEKKVRSGFWKTVKRAAGKVPFLDEVVAAYYCALDPNTPMKVRGILLASLAYFVLPLDTITDFLIGFGFTDDIAVLLAAFNAVRGNITPAHREAARKAIADAADAGSDGPAAGGKNRETA